jgi:hypothetical protein
MSRVFPSGNTNALVSASQFLTSLNDFSAAFWAYRTGTVGFTDNIVGSVESSVSSGWTLKFVATTNVVQAHYIAATTNKVRLSTTALTLNAWTHIVITHKNTGLLSTDFLFYFNGKQEAGTDVSSQVGAHGNLATRMTIGFVSGATAPVNIGPVTVWNRMLSPSEALALAAGTHPLRFREGLVDFWNMQSSYIEEGWIKGILLVPTTPNPGVAINPRMEPPVIWPQIASY